MLRSCSERKRATHTEQVFPRFSCFVRVKWSDQLPTWLCRCPCSAVMDVGACCMICISLMIVHVPSDRRRVGLGQLQKRQPSEVRPFLHLHDLRYARTKTKRSMILCAPRYTSKAPVIILSYDLTRTNPQSTVASEIAQTRRSAQQLQQPLMHFLEADIEFAHESRKI